jgi:serine/threonine protein kinase
MSAPADPGTWPTRPMDATPVLMPPAEAIPGLPDRLGPFKLVKQLGRGGMGVVFLAEDTQLGRRAAVKVMRPEMTAYDPRAYERFLREARAAAAVRHDHVVTVYQVGEANGIPYLAMELLRGTTLSAYLDKGQTLAIPVATRVGREIAEGLAAAHAKGLVHRDIKPGNIWLEAPNGRVKLLDFGLARPAGPDVPGPDRLTGSGLVVGTPGYMSPEQARGVALDERTDLFSLGAVLYLLCTGTEPFAGANPTAILTALAVDQQKPAREMNPKVPAALSDLIDRLLEKKPTDRPASAAEVAKALRQIERGQVPPAPALLAAEAEAPTYQMGQPTQPAAVEPARPTDRPKPTRRTGRRRKKPKPARAAWLIAAFAGLVPVLIGATWLIAREDRPTDSKAVESKKSAEPKAGEPKGYPPPPPPPGPGGLRPGMPGYGPPPKDGPGSPGFGPPPGGGHPFPPPKD